MKRLLVCAILLAFTGVASAVVYKWTDAQGKVQYGDRPPDGVHAEVVEGLGTHAGHLSTTSRPAEAAPNAAAKAPMSGGPATKDAKKAVDADVAQSRDQQCADAQERYKKLIEGRRLYKTGTDGERQYMTSEEIDSERVNAKRDIDLICNSPT
jgi:hypothetical protein